MTWDSLHVCLSACRKRCLNMVMLGSGYMVSLGLLWGVKGCSRVSCAIVAQCSLENHSVVHVSLGTFPSAPVTGKLSTALLVAPLLRAAAFPAPTRAKLLLPGAPPAFHALPACLNPTPVVNLGQPQPLGTAMPTRHGEKKPNYQTINCPLSLTIAGNSHGSDAWTGQVTSAGQRRRAHPELQLPACHRAQHGRADPPALRRKLHLPACNGAHRGPRRPNTTSPGMLRGPRVP